MDVTTDIPMELRRRMTYATFLDVGKGSAEALNISEITLRKAVHLLVVEGYKLFYLGSTQKETLRYTIIRVLGRPNATYGEALNSRDKIEKIS